MKSLTKKTILIPLIFIFLLLSWGCSTGNNMMFLEGFTELNLYGSGGCGGGTSACEKEIRKFLTDFENSISVNIASSEAARFNSAVAQEKIYLSDHVYNVFKLSMEIYNNTDGAFNFCLYDLSLLWGFYPDNSNFGNIPSQSEIDNLKEYAKPEYIVLDDEEKTVYKTVNGVKIDFGGIAKGYAAGVCREIARSYGVKGGIINIAGNIYCIGEYNAKGEKKQKKIGITDPRAFEHENAYFCILMLNDCSVSVSGDYQRSFEKNGKKYCHIIDPFTGSPVQNGIISVIIADKNASLADAYSTAVMVSGVDKGLMLMNENNISGIIITKEKNYYIAGDLEISDVYIKEYTQLYL